MSKVFTRIRRAMGEIIDKDDVYPAWKEILIDIKDWFYDKLIRTPKQKIKAINRVIEWAPVVWMNYDWDYHYLFIIMYHKLDRMENCIRIYGHAVNNEQTADNIKVAKLLLDRICKNDYVEKATRQLDKEYGGWDFDWSSKHLKKIYRRPLTEKQIYYYDKATEKAYRHAEYMKKQDIEYLFKYMQKHYQKWWD